MRRSCWRQAVRACQSNESGVAKSKRMFTVNHHAHIALPLRSTHARVCCRLVLSGEVHDEDVRGRRRYSDSGKSGDEDGGSHGGVDGVRSVHDCMCVCNATAVRRVRIDSLCVSSWLFQEAS
jgi:hypothetical protein